MLAPGGVGGTPVLLRQTGGAVDVVPVGGIMLGELVQPPSDAHFTEHCQVGGRISLEGIEQGPIPVEEDAIDFVFLGEGHAPSNITEVGNKVKEATLKILRRRGRLCTRSKVRELCVSGQNVVVSP